MKKLYLFILLFCVAQLGWAQLTVTTNISSATICAGNSLTITASATPTVGTITYNWSPAHGLNTTTGATVIATPEDNITYTVTAVDQSNNAVGSNNVTIDIDNNSFILAGTPGGPQVCQNITISPSGSVYRGGDCKIIAGITPAGANPVVNSINTCTKVYNGPSKLGTTNFYLARKYDIEPATNPSTSTAIVKLYYSQKEFDDFNAMAEDSGVSKIPSAPEDAFGIENIIIKQFHGTGTAPGNYTGSFEDFTSASPGVSIEWNSKTDWWEVTLPVTGFSGFYITSKKGNVAPLPIRMEYFKGAQADKKNNLTWKANCTSTEALFQVERSSDAQHFYPLTQIRADRLRCNMPFDYSDVTPLSGKNYYRIKTTDVDGKFEYSNIVVLNLKNKAFELSMNPNIVSGESASVKVISAEKYEMVIVISDINGRKIQHQTGTLRQGTNSIKINTGALSTGTYLLSAYVAGNETQTLKFIKQ